MAMPTLSSTLKIFFWCDESSLLARFSVATSANLSERSPIAALPCLTASSAYSIWWIRPAGDQVVQSVSYWFRNIARGRRDCRRGRQKAKLARISLGGRGWDAESGAWRADRRRPLGRRAAGFFFL